MARFTRQISAMEVRATQKNRVRYSSKNIKHLPSCTITEFDLKDYSPLGFRYNVFANVSCHFFSFL